MQYPDYVATGARIMETLGVVAMLLGTVVAAVLDA